jgi:hypothetical protein
MKIIEFINRFSSEEECKAYFRDVRIKEGGVCKKCKNKKHYWLKGKWQFQCSNCKFRTTLKSGTVMENSRVSYQKWFLIIFMMTSTKKGYSACEMARQVEHKTYKTIWAIMHRLREAMGLRDEKYVLKDMVEFDEGFFPTEISKKERENLKRSKGSQRQQNVAVMAESIPLEDLETGTTTRYCRYFKMKALNGHASEDIEQEVKKSLDAETIVFSDKSTSYKGIDDLVEAHFVEKSCNEVTATS